ncbi:unnamed protein product, partial [Mesorhabditis spiculigera]
MADEDATISGLEACMSHVDFADQPQKFPIDKLPQALVDLVLERTTIHQRFTISRANRKLRERVREFGVVPKRVKYVGVEQLALDAMAITIDTATGDSICIGCCEEGALIQNTRTDREPDASGTEETLNNSQMDHLLRKSFDKMRPRTAELWDTAIRIIPKPQALKFGHNLIIRFMDADTVQPCLKLAETTPPQNLCLRPALFWASQACDRRCFAVGAQLHQYNYLKDVDTVHLMGLHYPPFFTCLPTKNVFVWQAADIPIVYILKDLLEKRKWEYRPKTIGFLDAKRSEKTTAIRDLLDQYRLSGGCEGDYAIYKIPIQRGKASVVFCEKHVIISRKYDAENVKEAIRRFYEMKPLLAKE